MLYVLALLCLAGAVAVLAILSAIDLKYYLLPNVWVAVFAALGVTFHAITMFAWASPPDMAFGALIGGGSLFVIRFVANHIMKDDTLGLGDVKLLAATGLWLGSTFTLIAMTTGAMAGILHGLGVAIVQKKSLKTLSVPAGPGFAVGIVGAGAVKFASLLL